MLLGIDVSKWQGGMDWSMAWSAGANYAFIRAGSISTGGYLYTDYQFEINARIAPDYMPVGFYWYFRPQFAPDEQADYFCNLIRDSRSKLPPVLDLETDGDLSPEEITEAARIFVLQVFVNLDIWPLLYSRALWLNDNTVPDAAWDYVNLWIARYKDIDGPWADGHCIPRDFDEWDFWQFSADNNGRGHEFGATSRSIDLNLFNGDQEAFDNYIGSPLPEYIRVNHWRNSVLRNSPNGKFETIAFRNEELKVLDKEADDNDREWYQTASGLWLPVSQVEPVE